MSIEKAIDKIILEIGYRYQHIKDCHIMNTMALLSGTPKSKLSACRVALRLTNN